MEYNVEYREKKKAELVEKAGNIMTQAAYDLEMVESDLWDLHNEHYEPEEEEKCDDDFEIDDIQDRHAVVQDLRFACELAASEIEGND